MKIDKRTAQYLVKNFYNYVDEQLIFECCNECGSQYIEEVGHYCGDSIELPVHNIKEGDIVEPIKIIPRSSTEDNDEAAENIFNVLF